MLKVVKKVVADEMPFFPFKVFCLCFFYYFYFILLSVLNWEAGKGIRKILNSLEKKKSGGKNVSLIQSRGKEWMLEMGPSWYPRMGTRLSSSSAGRQLL